MVAGQAPEGDGWSATEATRQGEQLTAAIPASTVEELVSAAVPAGAPCAPPVVPPVVSGGGAGDGGADDPATPADVSKAPSAKPAADSKAPSAVPAALAFTGADTGNYLAGGLVLTFLGAGLIVAARRRQDTSS